MVNEKILEFDITPNQYFLAWCVDNSRKDLFEKMLTIDKEDKIKNDLYYLYIKGFLNCEFCETQTFNFDKMKVEKLFDVQIKIKVKNEEDFTIFTNSLYEKFPKGIKSGNDPVRSGLEEFKSKLQKYIISHKTHNSEIITKAFDIYIERCRKNNWSFMKKAGNFISKVENGSKTSVLESICEEIIDNPNIEIKVASITSNVQGI